MQARVNIPVDIAPFLASEKLHKPFQVLICLKLLGYSKIKDLHEALHECEKHLGPKYRTLKKHFNRCVELKWIGTDRYGNHYLRTVNYLRTQYKSSSRRFVSITLDEIKNSKEFVNASFLTHSVVNQQTVNWIYKNKRNQSRVTRDKDGAEQRDEFLISTNYTGMSSATFGKKLGVHRSTAQREIHNAAIKGFVKVKPKKKYLLRDVAYKEVIAFKKADLYDAEKLFTTETTASKNGKTVNGRRFNLCLRLHNEITTNLNMKKRTSWSLYSPNV